VDFTLDGGHNAEALGCVSAELGRRLASSAAAGEGGTGAGAGTAVLIFACGASRSLQENLALLLGGLLSSSRSSSRGAAPSLRRLLLLAVPYNTPEGMPWARSHTPEAVAEAALRELELQAQGAASAAVSASVEACSSLQQALLRISQEEELCGERCLRAICGSLYLVSDVHRLLRGSSATLT